MSLKSSVLNKLKKPTKKISFAEFKKQKRIQRNPAWANFYHDAKRTYPGRSMYACKLMGEVNSDQCYTCFVCNLANRKETSYELPTRVLCKANYVTRDDARIKYLAQKKQEKLAAIDKLRAELRARKKKHKKKEPDISKMSPFEKFKFLRRQKHTAQSQM